MNGSSEPTEAAQATLPHVDTGPTGAPRSPEEPATDELPSDVYKVKLDVFEGPLDLLLHLIRKHELDILDIPVGFVTEKYLEYLSLMQELTIDVASEYLVMAATLAHIKSKMLLPPDPNAEEDEEGESGEEADPRAELVRRLLEYQKYKHAAERIADRAAVGRDMFPRGSSEPMPEGPAPLASFDAFRLFDAFQRVLKRADQVADHQVLFERVSIADRIVELTELLHDKRRLLFDELFDAVDDEGGPRPPTRLELVVTFLALLEMGKMRVVRIVQDHALGPIAVELAAKHLHGPSPESIEAIEDEPTVEADELVAGHPDASPAATAESEDDEAALVDAEAPTVDAEPPPEVADHAAPVSLGVEASEDEELGLESGPFEGEAT